MQNAETRIILCNMQYLTLSNWTVALLLCRQKHCSSRWHVHLFFFLSSKWHVHLSFPCNLQFSQSHLQLFLIHLWHEQCCDCVFEKCLISSYENRNSQKIFPHNKNLKLFLIIKIWNWKARVAWFDYIWRLSYYYNAAATAVCWIDPNLQPTDQLFCSCFLELAPSNPFLSRSQKIRVFGMKRW